jgi:putative phosphoesterase
MPESQDRTITLGIISDTHGQPLHPAILDLFVGVNAILHAGDVGDESILDELEALAPVFAVAGNTDISSARLPLTRLVDLPTGKAAIAHGHLFPVDIDERAAALARTFAPAGVRLVVTGHSHQRLVRQLGSVLVLNPGAACRKRFSRDDRGIALVRWTGDSVTAELCRLD